MKCAARSCRSRFGIPAISSGNATLSMTVRQGNVDSSWNTMPIAGCVPDTGLSLDGDAAFVVADQPADDVEERRLAAAGRPDDRHELARCDGERNVVDRQQRVFSGTEALDDVGRPPGSAPWRRRATRAAAAPRERRPPLPARRNLDQLGELLLRERRGRELERDGVLHDRVETDDPCPDRPPASERNRRACASPSRSEMPTKSA